MQCGYCRKAVETDDPLVCGSCHVMVYCGDACAQADWERVDGKTHAKDHYDYPYMDLILGSGDKGDDSIYLGSLDALMNLSNIDAVLSVLGENYDNKRIEQLVSPKRWHLRVTIWDDPDENIAYYFESTAKWIHEQMKQRRHVLIHCVAGMSRSATLLIFYMMRYAGFPSVEAALKHIQARRSIAQPNSGFMKQLKEWGEKRKGRK